jgi:hypothetical protein
VDGFWTQVDGFWTQVDGFGPKFTVLDENVMFYMQVYGFSERLVSPTLYPALRAPPSDALDLGSTDSNSASIEEQPSVVTVTSPIDVPGPESTI